MNFLSGKNAMHCAKVKPMPLKNPALQYMYCLTIMCLACGFIRFPASFTNSGAISLYGSEIIGIITGICMAVYMVKNWASLERNIKLSFWAAVAFFGYFIVVYTIRILLQGLELKSILLLEANLFLVGFVFLLLCKIIRVNIVVKSMNLFAVSLGILTIVVFLFFHRRAIGWGLLPHLSRTYILACLLPLSALNNSRQRMARWTVAYYIHLACLVFSYMSSGTRLGNILIPLVIVSTTIFLARTKRNHVIRNTAIVWILMIIVMFALSPNHIYLYSVLIRQPHTNAMMRALKLEYNMPKVSNPNLLSTDIDLEEMKRKLSESGLSEEEKDVLLQYVIVESAQEGNKNSNAMRSNAWKRAIEDIGSNPLFGVGLRQYTDGRAGSIPIPPHNFILEYTLGVGLIGFFLWGVMVALPLFLSIKWGASMSGTTGMMFVTLLYACTNALFQPYFISPGVMTFIYLLIGCYAVIIRQNGDIASADSSS